MKTMEALDWLRREGIEEVVALMYCWDKFSQQEKASLPFKKLRAIYQSCNKMGSYFQLRKEEVLRIIGNKEKTPDQKLWYWRELKNSIFSHDPEVIWAEIISSLKTVGEKQYLWTCLINNQQAQEIRDPELEEKLVQAWRMLEASISNMLEDK